MVGASRQLALSLFADYSLTEKSVEEAPVDLGFRRNNALVKIVDLSLGGRRLLDVAYFIAADDTVLHKQYRVDIGLFRWLLGTTSRNSRHLMKIIREAQKAALELNEVDDSNPSNDYYGAVPLLGPAFVRNGEFLFELSDRLQLAIKNPISSHLLSLRYVFKSIHSRILYDRLQLFMADGITPWFDVQSLRVWLECETKTYDLFKHFRNKVLDVAINEIREVVKLEVEMQTMNVPGSKKIGQVRFKITQPAGKSEQKFEFIVLRALYDTLQTEFALNQDEFNEIISNREIYTDERIQKAIDYTRQNVANGKVKLRAGGYFMKSLREGYSFGTLDQQIHSRIADASASKAAANKKAKAIENEVTTSAIEKNRELAELGWEAFSDLEPEQQAASLMDFCKSTMAKPLARSIGVETTELREHLTDPKVRSSFGVFIATKIHQASKAAKQAARATAS